MILFGIKFIRCFVVIEQNKRKSNIFTAASAAALNIRHKVIILY